jgi:hypothetical protein
MVERFSRSGQEMIEAYLVLFCRFNRLHYDRLVDGYSGTACFLVAALGPEKIWMIGDNPATQEGRVRLLPPYALYDSPEDFDVVLNVDSLTEMDAKQAVTYLRYAFDHARALISINHEFNAHTIQTLADMGGSPSVRSAATVPALNPRYSLLLGTPSDLIKPNPVSYLPLRVWPRYTLASEGD